MQRPDIPAKDTNDATDGVSVVVCCYNSAMRIRTTLDHLSGQSIPGPWKAEIILVDNRSTDGCGALAQDHWKSKGSPFDFHLVREENAGLSNARHRGVMESRYETIIFCDDDNWLCPEFLVNAREILLRHPEAVVAGGPIEGEYEAGKPEAIAGYEGFMAVGKFHREGDITMERPYVPGAGLVMRKSAYLGLLKSGFRFFCSDRKGADLSSGGDTELCYALVLAGGRIYYSSSLMLKHFIPAARTEWTYMRKLLPAIAAATVILNVYKRAIFRKENGRRIIWRDALREARYVWNPLQVRNYKRTLFPFSRNQIKFESSRRSLAVMLSFLFHPSYYSSLKRQLRLLQSQ